MKKYLIVAVCAVFAAVMLCVGVGADTVASGTCGRNGENLAWELDDNGTLTISGEGEMERWNIASKVPWYSYRSEIEAVVIGDGVTSIGNWAFLDCENLTNVYIADLTAWCNIEYANSASHPLNSNDGNLYINGVLATDIVIPDSVIAIGEYAFYNCSSLTSVTIPNGVVGIGKKAFCDCDSLASVTIPNGVSIIGYRAFFGCDSLTSVTIPDSVTSIGEEAFYYCRKLIETTIYSRTVSFGDNVFYKTHSAFTIHGFAGSTAQSYAEANSHKFKVLADSEVEPDEPIVTGDATGDGVTNPLDLVYFQRYLSNWDGYDETTVCTAALDLNLDGRADAADATILARHIAKWVGYETLPYNPA